MNNEEIKQLVQRDERVVKYFEREDWGMAILNAIDKALELKDKENSNKIIIEEESICLIPKDEINILKEGDLGKVFVNGKYFWLKQIRE